MADIKLTASLDKTNVMSGIHELRSQLGMALASATGFNNAAMALGGTPNLGGAGFGGTHTNAAMSYTPHYGAIQASTSLQQEWQVGRYGLAAAQQLKPPGVSAGTYAMGAMSNAIDRDIQARQQSQMAARAAFHTGAGGLAAGEGAAMIAAPAGAFVGGRLAGRFFGKGAMGAGKMLGGLAAAWTAFDWANEYVGGKISEHYAQVEQIGGVTKELGQLAGGGRGLGRLQQYNLGVAARQAAGDLKMDVNQMGDVLALGRQAGMLPTATEPGKARQQYREFAQAIEEGAQVLKSSLAGATQVIKTATQQGMSAQEGIARAAGAGGADQWLAQQARMRAFSGAGASVGMSMGFTPGQGGGMFTGSLGAAGQAGLTGAETKIMGGRFGAAQFVGTTQMAMAASPMGNVQLMAAMSGQDLSGVGMLGMAGAAMDAMSQGGDFMSNMGKFMVHQNEYRRGIGTRGIRTMAREQLRMGGDMISQFMPDLSANEAQRLYAQSMGLNPDQAKTLVGGGRGGGGGGGSGGGMSHTAQARAAIALNNAAVGNVEGGLSGQQLMDKADAGKASWGWKGAAEGALWGAMGGPKGMIAGAVVGGLIENGKALWQTISGSGPPTFSSAESKADFYQRKAANEYDSRMSAAKTKAGYRDLDVEVTANFLKNDLSGARLSYTAASDMGMSMGSYRTDDGGTVEVHQGTKQEAQVRQAEGIAVAMGLEEVEAGPGTIEMNGKYFRISDYQKIANQPLWGKKISEKDKDFAKEMAFKTAGDRRAASRWGVMRRNDKQFNADLKAAGIAKGDVLGLLDDRAAEGNEQAAEWAKGMRYDIQDHKRQIHVAWEGLRTGGRFADKNARALSSMTQQFIGQIEDEGDRARMQKAWSQGGISNPLIKEYLQGVSGRELKHIDSARIATVAGGAAGGNALESLATREANYLSETFGGQMYLPGSARSRATGAFLDRVYKDHDAGVAGNLVDTMLTPKGQEVLMKAGRDENIVETALRLGMKGHEMDKLFTDNAMTAYPKDVQSKKDIDKHGYRVGYGTTKVDGTRVQSNYVRAAKGLKGALGEREMGDFQDFLSAEGYTGGLPGQDIQKTYYEKLVQHPKYIMAKAAAARGDAGKAQQLMDQAQMFTKSEGGKTFEGFDYKKIDVTDKTMHQKGATQVVGEMQVFHGAYKGINAVASWMGMGKPIGKTQLETVDKDMQKKVLEKVSFMDYAKAEVRPGGVKKGLGKRRRRRRGAGSLQRAAGFGQRESAMSSINRSLRHAERTLKMTNDSVARLATWIQNAPKGDK
jgi:hypothetical protein